MLNDHCDAASEGNCTSYISSLLTCYSYFETCGVISLHFVLYCNMCLHFVTVMLNDYFVRLPQRCMQLPHFIFVVLCVVKSCQTLSQPCWTTFGRLPQLCFTFCHRFVTHFITSCHTRHHILPRTCLTTSNNGRWLPSCMHARLTNISVCVTIVTFHHTLSQPSWTIHSWGSS